MRVEYTRIAIAMISFDIGELVSITALAKRAKVHYMTAKRALIFFDAIKKLDIPTIKMTDKGKFILCRDSERSPTE